MTPNYKILANAADITDLLNGRLLSLSISDEIGLVSDTLTIELDDRDNALAIPPRGAELEAFLGYGDLYPMGWFIVDEIELSSPPAKMTITARASDSALGDMAAFRSPCSYSWENYTLLGIVQTIAKRYGLQESVAEAFRKILVSHYDQTDESDCAFIQRVAQDYGASVKIAGGRLLFIEPLSGKFPDGTPMPAIPIMDIASYQMRLTERGKYGKVIAKYYDFDTAEEKQLSAGSESPAFTLRDTFISATQARIRARAKLAEIAAGTKTLSLECVGNPLVGAESVIEVAGIRADVCGRWIVKSARHTLGASGYKTQIEATRKD